jgi:hypothetical protein
VVQLANAKLPFVGVALSVTVSPTLASQLDALLQRAFASLTVAVPLPPLTALIVTQPNRHAAAACASAVGVATGEPTGETLLAKGRAKLGRSVALG